MATDPRTNEQGRSARSPNRPDGYARPHRAESEFGAPVARRHSGNSFRELRQCFGVGVLVAQSVPRGRMRMVSPTNFGASRRPDPDDHDLRKQKSREILAAFRFRFPNPSEPVP